MSKIVSFRLSKENPREAQAYEVLKARYDKGYSIRHTITEALLKLDEPGLDSVMGASLDDINKTLNQVRELLERIGNDDNSSQKSQNPGPYYSGLTDNFILSIRKVSKPGIRLD